MEKRIRLDDLERKHPFNVPEGYFENLSDRIIERVEQGSVQEERPVIELKPVRKWWRIPAVVTTAVAASIALVVALIWVTLPEKQGPLAPDTLFAVSDAAILDYLESQELDYYDLASQDVIQKAFSDESMLIHFLEDVDEDLIHQYLEEDSIYDETI